MPTTACEISIWWVYILSDCLNQTSDFTDSALECRNNEQGREKIFSDNVGILFFSCLWQISPQTGTWVSSEPRRGPPLRLHSWARPRADTEFWPAKARNLPSQGSVLCFLTLFSLIKSLCRSTSQTVYIFLWMNVSFCCCKDEKGKMCINIYNRAVARKVYNSPKLLISHTPVRCDKDVNFLNWESSLLNSFGRFTL